MNTAKLNKSILLVILVTCVLYDSPSSIIFVGTSTTEIDDGNWMGRYNPSTETSIIYEYNVGNPFGVCHGDSGNDGHEQMYSISFNRKDLAWAWIEPYNGTFCFNGLTVVDEFYSAEEMDGLNITLRYYSLNASLGNTVFAYRDDDESKSINLFDSVVDNTNRTINLTTPIPAGRGVYVTYNKSNYEPNPFVDPYVQDHMKNGIKYLPILDYSNAYLYQLFKSEYDAMGFGPEAIGWYIPPSAIWHWLRFINRTVSYFKDYVDYWEIWNEANNQYKGQSMWEYFLYNITLKAAKIIRAIDPTSKIYIGGLGGTDEFEYLQYIFESILANHDNWQFFDGIAFHPYSGIAETLISSKLNNYFKIMNNYGWTRENGKAYLITEYGMPTNGTGAGTYSPDIQQVQASNCVKGMTIAADTGAEIFIYYCYHDDPTWLSHPGFSDTEWFFGLFEYNKNPKKGAFAFNITSYLLSNSIARRGSLVYQTDACLFNKEERIFGYNFRKLDGTEIIILWNTYHLPLKTTIKIPGGLAENAYCYSWLENSKILIKEAGVAQESINFEINYDPIIISYKPNLPTEKILVKINGNLLIYLNVFVIPSVLGCLSVAMIIIAVENKKVR